MSPADDLAEVLDGLARAREAASDPDAKHILMTPKPVYPMSLLAVQLTINPFEFFMLLALFISGLAYVGLGVPIPTSVGDLLPSVWGVIWSLNVALGSGLALVGGLWRKQVERALLIYQLGWGLAGIGALIYGVAVLMKFNVVGLYPSMINLLVSAACAVRVFQVSRFFRVADMIARGVLHLPIPVAALPPTPPLPSVQPPRDGGDDDDAAGLRPGG